MKLLPPKLIDKEHNLEHFDCGVEVLNRFLKKDALINVAAESARTYVAATEDGQVIGYYSLAAASATREEAPIRITKGLAKHAIPLILLARLAIDIKFQNQGIGKGLLKDALVNCAKGADVMGIRAVVVHAKDNAAKKFYEQFGFEPCPTNELHLMLLMKDIRKSIAH